MPKPRKTKRTGARPVHRVAPLVRNGKEKTVLEARRDDYGLFWHVTVTRKSDGVSAYTTTTEKPKESDKTVQALIKSLQHS